ncbi:helix-turn-helix transcriptional regulator [Coprobacillus sp. AF33-1AC]|uniref:helix-turn-helix domain-containing protein n=1 Tax=Coprobacillus sp. AF33-1AC TaxID=2292032 RepID=UPI000E5238F7|nr:helix-turn-helix transcriptional regulator [Coprobacillus sp. AF33-1AC]RHM59683.1 XRE family transcriptional regulator [Coprobacillus sp. AF33-1AC]
MERKYTLKEIRILTNDMTQEEFAKMIGIEYRRYQNLESGKVKLLAKELFQICDNTAFSPKQVKL